MAPGGQMTEQLQLVGIGSVVLDRIYRADSILGAESKGMVRECTEIVGGLTLNHLAWARVFGLRTGLFGRQGRDAPGAQIRAYLDALGIDRTHLRTDGEGSSTANIFVDPQGERCIYMYPAATATTTPEHIDTYFADYIRAAGMVSTEISQLPLATTIRVLEIARDAGIPAALDVDIPPSQAVNEARLGTMEDVERALGLATILKPAASAVRELAPAETTEALAEMLFARLAPHGRLTLLALTDGATGSVLCDGARTITVPAYAGVHVVDTTGAGDAYFGALLAGRHYGLDLEALGKLANAGGAACVELLGATPHPSVSRARALELYDGPSLPAEADSGQPPEPTAGTAAEAGAACLRILADEVATWVASVPPAQLAAAATCVEQRVHAGGRVHVTGVGKPEHVARYAASLLSSTGTPAQFLHATECVHGSAGQVLAGDVVIAISNSGSTPEVLAAAEAVRALGAQVIAITRATDTPLAACADVTIVAGVQHEGGPLGLAPRASVLVATAALAALSAELQARRGLTREQYAQWHPAGALGQTARDS